MAKPRAFGQVDVFSVTPFMGNPVTGLTSARFQVSQGQRVGRTGEIAIYTDDDGTVWIGGVVMMCIRGEISV